MPATKRLKSYDAAFKLKVTAYAEEHGNRAAGREFCINESMVRRWRKQKDELKKTKKTKKAFRGAKARWPALEEKVELWVNEQRAAGRGVSTISIRLKAKTLATEMDIKEFQGGPSWCFRFMRRKELTIRTRTTVCQKLPADWEEKLQCYRDYCKDVITENKIKPEHITNMDEVPLTFDIPMTRTVEKSGTKMVPIKTTGNEKASFTVVLGCTAAGNRLPPMVIFKRKTLPKEKFPPGVIVRANPKGWMDESVMNDWLDSVHVKRPGGFFHIEKSLLTLDSMTAHKTESVKEHLKRQNSKIAIIPGGLTKLLQPLDISVNRSFKQHVRMSWEKWMCDGEHSFTKTGRQRRASYALVTEWILDAWKKVPISAIVNGFRKSGKLPEDMVLPEFEDSDDEDDEMETQSMDTMTPELAEIYASLFNDETEDEEFEGFASDDCRDLN